MDGQLHQQIDGVSMGSSLGPVLANVIMTEMEKIVVEPLLQDGTIAFYKRYVDDTLLLIKPEKLSDVLDSFNSFHPKIKFTSDDFPDCDIHFLDLKVSSDLLLDIYRKDSFTGQYVRFDSFEPWNYKIGWIRSLYFRSLKLCSNANLFKKQLDFLDQLLSWNLYPKYVRKSIFARLEKMYNNQNPVSPTPEIDISKDITTIWFKVPYFGKEGEKLVNRCVRRLKYCFKPDAIVKFRISYNTKKLAIFCSNKDKIPLGLKSNCIYEFTCPCCSASYIGKTDRNFDTRVNEHGTHSKGQDTVVYQHLQECTEFKYYVTLLNMPCVNDRSKVKSIDAYIHHTVRNNTTLIQYNDNWLQLCFLEAYFIKLKKPLLNTGLKASRDLVLFK